MLTCLGVIVTAPPASAAKARASTIMCAKVAAKAGFSFDKTVATSRGSQPQIVVAIAVAMAESDCTLGVKNVNSGGSVDRGLWQLNSYHRPEVSDRCAYQIQCNANAAWTISSHGTRWSPWSAYKNGSWTRHLDDARAAIAGGFTFLLWNEGAGTCLAADRGLDVCDPGDSRHQWTVTSAVGTVPILRNAGSGTAVRVRFIGTGRLNVNGNADVLMQTDDGTCVAADPVARTIRQRTCDLGDVYQMWN